MQVLRFQQVLAHGMNAGSPDLGLAKKGTLRPLIGEFTDSRNSYALQQIWAYDRTLTEWNDLIRDHKERFPVRFWSTSLTTHPWADYVKTGDEIEMFFIQNQRMRWLARKWIARVRMRVMEKRIVGHEDIYTCDTIPPNALVRVFDYTTRSVYQFHTNTMIKLLLTQLTYGSYGIPAPATPKNPYTNIPWNLQQLVSIITQISNNLMKSHRMIPLMLYNYRQAQYKIPEFYAKSRMQLCIDVAVAFFKNKYDTDARAIFLETYDDLVDYSGLALIRHRIIRRLLEDGKLSNGLYASWMDLITSYWIYSNHAFLYRVTSVEDCVVRLQSLYTKSMDEYRSTVPRRGITSVPTVPTVPPVPPVPAVPPVVAIIDLHHILSATTGVTEVANIENAINAFVLNL